MNAPLTKQFLNVHSSPQSSAGNRLSSRLDRARPQLARGHQRIGRRALRFLIVLLLLNSLADESARAQANDPDDPFAGIEEMVVVGTGAASLFQDQEVSAIAFDSDYLDAIGASDLSDVATFTPNLEIRTPFAASNPTLFIRGVGLRDFNANSSSSVAVYNDEVYMNSPAGQLAQLFDTQNIDVLRGPQTSIYARNASAGTIRVITKKPTGTPGGTASVTYGRFNELTLETAVENVIVPDMFSMRTAAKWSQRDGTTKNRCADIDYAGPLPPRNQSNGASPENQQRALLRGVALQCFAPENTDPSNSPPGNGWVSKPAPVKEWVNDTKNWAARTIFRFEHPFLDMDWQLNLHGGQNRGDARQFQVVGADQAQGEQEPSVSTGNTDANGYFDVDNRLWTGRLDYNRNITDPFLGNPFEGDYNSVEKEKIDLFGSNLVGEMTFGDYTLKTITGYEWNKRDTELNLDGNPYASLEPQLNNKAYQLTQELRLDWDDGGGFAWQLGAMYLYESLEVQNTFSLALLLPETEQNYSFFTRYAAGWGSVTWEPIETFKIHAGVRINYEDKELNLQSRQFLVIPGTGDRTPYLQPQFANSAARESGWAGDVIATYSPINDVSFYLRYARGWKGPHINGGITNPGPAGSERADLATPVEPEKVDSIEMGLKAEFWASRIRWNWAVFYYDYQDIQVFQLRNAGGNVPVQELINADDADVFGVEMEIDVKPFEGWAHPIFEQIWIRGTFAYLDSKYTDFVNTQDVIVDAGGGNISVTTVTEDFSGNQLVNSPEFSFIGFVAWPFAGDWGFLVPRFDWSFKDKVYFSPANADLVKQDPLWIMNLRLTYKSPSENFELSGWIENLTDQRYTVDVFNLARLRSSILHAVGDPRTYGLTMKVTF